MLQFIQTFLHLVDDVIFALMIHLIQFVRSEFLAHTIRPFCFVYSIIVAEKR